MCKEKILDEDIFGDGIEELQNGDDSIEIFIRRDSVNIPRSRYDELLRAENTLEILCRLLSNESSYFTSSVVKMFRAVCGDRIPKETEEQE